MSGRSVAHRLLGAAAISVLLVLTACSSSGGGGGTKAVGDTQLVPSAAASAAGTPSPRATPARVSVSPANQSDSVRPDTPVVVKATGAALTAVSVKPTDGSADVAGTFAADHRSWTSTSGLGPGVRYNVAATTAKSTLLSYFTTLSTANPFKVSWEPVDGDVVGVGEPIVLQFTSPVTDKAAVQKRLSVHASPAVNGSWHWYSDTEVHWRPQAYWRTGTKVTVKADLLGVEGADGAWGVKNRTMTFTIGPRQISHVDGDTHMMTVTKNGATVKTMPISLGRAEYPSMEGPHNVLARAPEVIMDSATVGIPKGNPDYYYEKVQWDVQFTSGGEYVHSAPWSTGAQGQNNVSHGCVNASPENAQWFYNFSQIGDIVDIKNTGRGPDLTQAGNDWSMPWTQWVAGDAVLGHTS